MINKKKIKRYNQQGSSLVVAVFVIIVMTLLTSAITATISSSQDQVVQEVMGTRALLAAESSNELALAELFPPDAGVNACAVVTTYRDLSTIDGFQNCIAVTSCTDNTINDQTYYVVESTGVCKNALAGDITDQTCNNNDKVCVSRTVEVEAREL